MCSIDLTILLSINVCNFTFGDNPRRNIDPFFVFKLYCPPYDESIILSQNLLKLNSFQITNLIRAPYVLQPVNHEYGFGVYSRVPTAIVLIAMICFNDSL